MSEMDVALAAHDLRNQLGVIAGAAELLHRRMDADAQVPIEAMQPIVACMANAVHDSTALLDELLAACDGSSAQDDQATVDLAALTRRLVALQRCASDSHSFHVCVKSHLVVGIWPEVGVARIIRNLLSNAVRYSPAGSAVYVEVDRDADSAILRIMDRGIGIPDADQPLVFTPYHRATNARGRGNGLGLTSATHIALELGGTIAVEKRPAGGSTFTVLLPLGPRQLRLSA
jgi:signal transduction histidine kinase